MTPYEAWEMICNWLRNNPISKNNYRFDVNNDDEILCRNESDANCIADFFESVGIDVVHTSETDDEDFKWSIYID